MRSSSLLALTFLSSVATLLSQVPTASACGGCFHGSNESTPSVVTGHRMALAVSMDRTVLWDQVQYSGNPKDFAWVLPVGPGAYIEEASPAFFEALEATTTTHIMSPTVTCSNGQVIQQNENNFSCGGSAAEPTTVDRGETRHQVGDDSDVTVVHEGTVGPYETVTLKADDPNALSAWLTGHGYVIPADIKPIIADYVKQKSEFIALRLQPNAGVRQMTPVRVVTPGASPTLPLKMVAAGTGADVSIVLYVIAEGRYGSANFPEGSIDFSSLSWDWSTLRSDYSTLRAQALAGGRFLTTRAQLGGLIATTTAPDGLLASYSVVGGSGQGYYENFTDLYFAQAASDAGTTSSCGGVAATLAAVEAGVLVSDADVLPEGAIDATTFACDGFTDLATALAGLHPRDVWVTRLEADLPREKLGQDLTLAATPPQVDVDNWHVAVENIGSPCPDPAVSPTGNGSGSASVGSSSPHDPSCAVSTDGRRSPFSSIVVSGLGAVALLFAGRRAFRRKRR